MGHWPSNSGFSLIRLKNSSALAGTRPSGRGTLSSLERIWLWPLCMPVIMLHRDGADSGHAVYMSVKTMPFAASASMFGVSMSFWP